MASSDFVGEADLTNVVEYQPVLGWWERVSLTWQYIAGCECCVRMEIGCLCEATTRDYELRVAQREMIRAQNAYDEWFEIHRQPQIDAERAETTARERVAWRRWYRRQRRSRRWRRQRAREVFASHNWGVLGETGGSAVGEEEGETVAWSELWGWRTRAEARLDALWAEEEDEGF